MVQSKVMKPLVVANWKMNTTLADASVLATIVRNQLEHIEGVDVVLCPPNIWLQEVASVLEISAPHIYLGAQNCYPDDFGPYTGEVSVAMLHDLCSYVIVGHSERREHFGETSEFVSDKVQAVLAAGMTPIVCVGERQKGTESWKRVVDQLQESLQGVHRGEYDRLVVAYEPIWSISTVTSGEVATGNYANEVCKQIKQIVGSETRILYGGSVSSENVTDFVSQNHIDGVLVGGASLKAKEFVELVQKAAVA